MGDYDKDGFNIHPRILQEDELEVLRKKCDRLQAEFEETCLRHLRAKSPKLGELAVDSRLLALIPSDLAPVRSILFDKTPEKNWPVAWHQDLTIAVTERREIHGFGPWSVKDKIPHVQPPVSFLESMITLRVHLDETPSSNGALIVAPGTHSMGKLSSEKIETETKAGGFPCDCRAGDILQMSPLILHSSNRSKLPHRRRILHFEYAPKNALPKELSFFEA